MTKLEELVLRYWNLYTVIDCEYAAKLVPIEAEYKDNQYSVDEYFKRLVSVEEEYRKSIAGLDRYLTTERRVLEAEQDILDA